MNPGREWEGPIHGLGREPCHVAAGKSDAGEQDVHSATTSRGTFLVQIIAEERPWGYFAYPFFFRRRTMILDGGSSAERPSNDNEILALDVMNIELESFGRENSYWSLGPGLPVVKRRR